MQYLDFTDVHPVLTGPVVAILIITIGAAFLRVFWSKKTKTQKAFGEWPDELRPVIEALAQNGATMLDPYQGHPKMELYGLAFVLKHYYNKGEVFVRISFWSIEDRESEYGKIFNIVKRVRGIVAEHNFAPESKVPADT